MTPTPLDAYKEWLKQGYPKHSTIVSREVLVKIQELHKHLKSLARYSAKLEIDLDEECRLRKRLSDLLEQTANALKGPPDSLHLHDWSDLPEVARQFREKLKWVIGICENPHYRTQQTTLQMGVLLDSIRRTIRIKELIK